MRRHVARHASRPVGRVSCGTLLTPCRHVYAHGHAHAHVYTHGPATRVCRHVDAHAETHRVAGKDESWSKYTGEHTHLVITQCKVVCQVSYHNIFFKKVTTSNLEQVDEADTKLSSLEAERGFFFMCRACRAAWRRMLKAGRRRRRASAGPKCDRMTVRAAGPSASAVGTLQ